MKGKQKSIICTAPVGNDAIQAAVTAGVDLDVLSFIDINYLQPAASVQHIAALASKPIVVVFTSQHAARSVSQMLVGLTTSWTIYCLGNKTKSTVNQLFSGISVFSDGATAKDVANNVVAAGVKELVFFCGSIRMDTLPDLLKDSNVEVEEMIVYETTETPKRIAENYDAILFFSPSGVNSFFTVNTIDPNVILFAIGNTTAAAIATHVGNKVVVSTLPAKETMVQEAIKYMLGIE